MVLPGQPMLVLGIFIVGIQRENLFVELARLIIIAIVPGRGRPTAQSPDMVLDEVQRFGFLHAFALLDHAQQALLVLEILALLLSLALGEPLLGTIEIGIDAEIKGSVIDPVDRPIVAVDRLVIIAFLGVLHGTIEMTLDLVAQHLSLNLELLTDVLGNHGNLAPAVSAKHANLIEKLLGPLVGRPEVQSLLKLQLGFEQLTEDPVLVGFRSQGCRSPLVDLARFAHTFEYIGGIAGLGYFSTIFLASTADRDAAVRLVGSLDLGFVLIDPLLRKGGSRSLCSRNFMSLSARTAIQKQKS